MGRSGYSDELDDESLSLYRDTVARILRCASGQSFLREMLAALDAMPQKRLISDLLEDGGDVCAIGSVGKARGLDMSKIDYEDPDRVGRAFGISRSMAAEIEWVNDEASWKTETPEQRFERVWKWVVANLAHLERTETSA